MSPIKSATILGGGPAGCQCALWLKMLGHEPIIIEQTGKLGGLQALSPYPNNWIIGNMNMTGLMLANNIEKHIKEMRIPVLFNSEITAFKKEQQGFSIWINEKEIQSHCLVIATGVKSREQNFIANEQVMIGPSDKIFHHDFSGKRVAILGGGDNAAENYAFVKLKNPALCHVYARTIRARKHLWSQINPEDIYLYPYEVDQSAMQVIQHTVKRLYDVILIMYGWEANFPTVLESLKSDLLNKHGFIATDQACRTPISDIYAIGEVANRSHPCVITAMADGIVAAKTIQVELDKRNNL